ncbi:MAG: hypothetical protein JJE18_07260 [Eubacteriaceae bacterium]|nr:hypothetical protein [Eubacteriaceae bacterium]
MKEGSQVSINREEIKLNINEEKHVEVLDVLLGDVDLMMAVNALASFEAGYILVSERIPGLTLEEFTSSMQLIKQVILAQMEKTSIQ